MNNQASEEEYEVEKILAKREFPTPKYLVKWIGYDIKESTWEPLEHLLNAMDLVDEFEKNEAISKLEKKKQKEDYLINQKSKRKNIFDENDDNSNYSDNKKSFPQNYYKESRDNRFDNKSKQRLKTQNIPYRPNYSRYNQNNEQSLLKNENILNYYPKNEEIEAIKNVKLIKNVIHCLVAFKAKSSGIKIEDAFIPSSILADNIPIELIEFYESKIKFI